MTTGDVFTRPKVPSIRVAFKNPMLLATPIITYVELPAQRSETRKDVTRLMVVVALPTTGLSV